MKPLEPLRVQSRHTIRVDGTTRLEHIVCCPRTHGWVSLARCRACDASAHVSEGKVPVVVCELAPSLTSSDRGSVRRHLAPAVWCIESDAPARLALAVPSAQAEAVVVDANGHAIGLLGRERAKAAEEGELASVLMQPGVVMLLGDAPVECAHALLSQRGVRTLPVVAGGRVVGCVETPVRSESKPTA